MSDDKNGFTRRSLLVSGLVIPSLSVLRPLTRQLVHQTAETLRPLPLTQVDITDGFWAPRMDVNRRVSIWHCFDRMQGNDAFGVSKLIEAAAYMLMKAPDPHLEAYVDRRIDDMLATVRPRIADPDRAVRVPGHFLEAAVAYAAATGKRAMLDAALEDAQTIDAAFGPGRKTYVSEHEGQKIGLLALSRESGDERYWKLAKFFLDQRGRTDYPRRGVYATDRTYAQDQALVVDQRDAVGHCVRATFLYIALAEIAAVTDADEYRRAGDAIWEDAVFRKMYVSGGIGSIRFHEQFGAPFELPNLSAWNETCAAYGQVVWNHRQFLLHRDARYIDVMERVLYNAFAAGVSLSGDRFFYQNPLKSFGDYERFEWINVPCCPPNVVRLTASIGNYIYAHTPRSVYVNLFIGSRAAIPLAQGTTVALTQETRYPWDGDIRIAVDPDQPAAVPILLRIPGWARNDAVPGNLYRYGDRVTSAPRLTVNGRTVEATIERGYARIERTWRKGDVIELRLPMPVRRVAADQAVREDRGMIAIERGPLVYCAEWPDNSGHALNVIVPDEASLSSEWRNDLLGGTQAIIGRVAAINRAADGVSRDERPHDLVAIPYHRWSNRGMGEMAVWLPQRRDSAWIAPVPPAPIRLVHSSGEVRKSWTGYNDQNSDIGAVYDGRDPLNSADESYRYVRMRPTPGAPAWIEYELSGPTRVSSVAVYWFDDRRFCRLPQSWRVLYRDGDQWRAVDNLDAYDVVKDAYNHVRFDPVVTMAVRLEVEPFTTHYAAGEIGPPDAMFIAEAIDWREFGLLEWRIA